MQIQLDIKATNMSMNKYKLRIGGKEITTNGVNLKSAIEKEGYVVRNMFHRNGRYNLNGKYDIILDGGTRMYAEWLNKKKKDK